MATITVRYSAIDGFSRMRKFKTVEGARKFAHRYVGADADLGTSYAVSVDGIGKVTVEGCTLMELIRGRKPARSLPYEVWYYQVNEMGGTSRAFLDCAFATLKEANTYAQQIEEYSDGVHLHGATDEAKAALDEQAKAFEEQCQRDRDYLF